MQTLVGSSPFVILTFVAILFIPSICQQECKHHIAMRLSNTMFVNFTGSTNKGAQVQLYKNGSWSENQGIVLVKYNNKWNFVNGSDWNYTDAMVVCRELGKYLYIHIQDQCIHKLRQMEFQLQVEQSTVSAKGYIHDKFATQCLQHTNHCELEFHLITILVITFKQLHVLPTYAGFDEVAGFHSSNTKYTMPQSRVRRSGEDFSKYLPGLVKALQCFGGERSISECLFEVLSSFTSKKFKALPPGTSATVNDVAWVACRGT